MNLKHLVVAFMAVTVSLVFLAAPSSAAKSSRKSNPDFTQGGKIPKGAKHDWNLGATGSRGWMFTDRFATTKARQILITKVENGSPAAKVLRVGDVILGIDGKPFSYDPRTEMGKAINTAESEENAGALSLIRGRDGERKNVGLTLSVMGRQKAAAVRDTIRAIQASKEEPKLIRIK
jgi:hypothetical protein